MKPAILASAVALATVLLGNGTTHAGKLYRWSEPDGALTFSPTPPADGTPYEEVDPMTMKPRTGAGVPPPPGGWNVAPGAAPAIRASPTPAARISAAGSPARGTSPADTGDVPALGAADVHRTGRPAVDRTAEATDKPDTTLPATGDTSVVPDGEPRGIIASTDKAERCEELQKRVVSLERRLATPLTPRDMDDTVVHMARYQQSYERNCRR